jgi:hypothetical protein
MWIQYNLEKNDVKSLRKINIKKNQIPFHYFKMNCTNFNIQNTWIYFKHFFWHVFNSQIFKKNYKDHQIFFFWLFEWEELFSKY